MEESSKQKSESFLDHNASQIDLQAIIMHTGTLTARYDYDAWGVLEPVSGSFDLDFGYTGHFIHHPSGLHLAPFRAYDPELGRWISRDPLRGAEFLPEGSNLYSYLGAEPIGRVDITGLAWYNPFSWDWRQIGSAFEGNFGVGLGLDAKVKVSAVELKTGVKGAVGSWCNLGGDGGMYVAGEANLLALRANRHQLGVGASHRSYTTRCPENNHIVGKEENSTVFGYKRDPIGVKSDDLSKIGVSANIFLIDLGGSISFGKIWKGITQ